MSRTDTSRRNFLKGSAAALGAAALPGRANAAPAKKRPNVLIMMTDQQNIDTIAAYRDLFNHPAHGTGWVKTPNLDRLAARGLNFIEGHSPCPVCGPARASMWTGLMPMQHGVVHNNLGIAKDVPNIAEWLEQHTDYQSYFCGKWHASGPWNYPSVSGKHKLPGFNTIPAGGTGLGDVLDYSISAATTAFLREYEEDKPFFYVASMMNPHDICFWTESLGGPFITRNRDYFGLGEDLPPLPPNQEYEFEDWEPFRRNTEWNGQVWRQYAYDYYRMIEKVDSDVGRILDAVDSRDDETLIIFTSDHGEGLGRHRRVQKWHPFEHSVKVPFIVAGAGVRQQGAYDTTNLVTQLDISATICDVAGAPPLPESQGRSLCPLLRGEAVNDWRTSMCYDFNITGRVLRTARYKYVKVYEKNQGKRNGRWYEDKDGNPAVHDPQAIKEYKVHPLHYLFDIEADPWETTNLAEDPAYAGIIEEHDEMMYQDWEKHWEYNHHNTIPR